MVDLGSHGLNKMDEGSNNFQIEELPSQRRAFSAGFLKYIRPCVAEMLATMLFVFVDVCSISGGFFAAFTHGFILFVLVAATAIVRYVLLSVNRMLLSMRESERAILNNLPLRIVVTK
jgi:hypothetical protein